jgi:RNA-directed DNA polymerase
MPNEKNAKTRQEKLLCVDNLRHTEYYGLQSTFDELYARSKNGEKFTDLMTLILSRENILLAYRNIKMNTGSKTQGTDNLTIADIGRLPPDEVVQKVRFIVAGSPHGYRPRAVRRKDIPKPYDPNKTRPLGIPCIWDRLIQQCIRQVMEPICEAKFSENSYGFRPNRSAEHAIARSYVLLQRQYLHYVVEFDIKGFFDNVNHSKLIKQIWAMGIHDKHLIYVLKQILTAKIKMPNGKLVAPDKGTPQGGIISPLLANIVLNELDHWVESQWEENPGAYKYFRVHKDGHTDKGHGYERMKKSRLKEMFIVRYADDFRIFCRTRTEAEKTRIAVTQWLSDRLSLEVSQEKTKVVNVKRRYSEFLGFKIKVWRKAEKYVVISHICDKQLSHAKQKLVEQAKNVARPREENTELYEIKLYNSMVSGVQNYYRIATHAVKDCDKINRAVMTVFTNRLRTQTGHRMAKAGRALTDVERKRYGKTKMLRYVAGTGEPIYPIGYVQHKKPMSKKKSVCQYTTEGRKELHDNLRINVSLMQKLMRQPLYGRSTEYTDNRISLFSAQWGKCAVTGKDFLGLNDIHCHHKLSRKQGGNDKYDNLILVLEPIHKLIHATQAETIAKYKKILELSKPQLKKINSLRENLNLCPVS